jgi:hypothetical protein
VEVDRLTLWVPSVPEELRLAAIAYRAGWADTPEPVLA